MPSRGEIVLHVSLRCRERFSRPSLACAASIMSSSSELSATTLAFLEQHNLRASNAWFLADSEASSLEAHLTGLREVWLEIKRRPRPAFPSVGFIFGRPKQQTAQRPAEPATSSKAMHSSKRLKAWGGLTSSAREAGKLTSDAAKRKQAAISALALVQRWPRGNHAQALASMAAEDLRNFEDRFIDTFANGASVACRINSFHHIERRCGQRQSDVWALQWADVQSYMWAPALARCRRL